MSDNLRPADLSEEDKELMFAFEQQHDDFSPRLHSERSDIFYSIDNVDFDRPVNPIEYRETVASKKRGWRKELKEEKLAVTSVSSSRKRKTLELPNVPAQVIRPVVKRPKFSAYERYTAPASLMRNVSLDWTRDHHHQQIREVIHQVENETADVNDPKSFQPIFWPGDAVSNCSEKDRSHSSSSSKSRVSDLELVCRRSLDVSSPMRVRLNDLALHSLVGSYTGS